MKKYTPLKKLLTGIVLLSTFFLLYHITGTNGLYDIESHIKNDTLNFLQKNLASIIANLVVIVLGIFMIYCAFSGTYRICTFNIHNRVFDDVPQGGVVVKGHSAYTNINRVLSYRESKMSSMSSERAAELYVGSAKLESLYSGYSQGPETQRVLSFIESKLSGMSSDRGLNYLANKI